MKDPEQVQQGCIQEIAREQGEAVKSEDIRVYKVMPGALIHYVYISAITASVGGMRFPDDVGSLQSKNRYVRRLVTDGIGEAEKLLDKKLDIEITDIDVLLVDATDDLILSASKLLALLLYGDGFSKSDLVFRDGKWAVLRT